MTMSKERVEFYATTEPPFGYTGGDIQAMARELLERRERDKQEPYGYVHQSVYEDCGSSGLSNDHEAYRDSTTHIPLYAAPPVPHELLSIAERLVDRYIANKGTESEFIACLTPGRSSVGTGGVWDDWKALDAALNACRAAMLQSFGNSEQIEPVSQTYKLPDGAEAIRNAEVAIDTGKIQAVRDVLSSPIIPVCWCRTCRPVRITDMRFVICPECGNKRCPKANDHRKSCSGSNEPGQDGSAYPSAPKQESE